MPRQANNVKNEPWHACAVCGWDWPLSELRWQRGALRCPLHFHNPDIWWRDRLIQHILSHGQEEELAVDKRLTTPQTDFMEW